MFGRLFSFFAPSSRVRAPADLPFIERDLVRHLFHERENFPHVDWDMASLSIEKHQPDPALQSSLRRAIAAAWLDEVRDSMKIDHRRWRSSTVEGLVPLEGSIGPALALTTEKALTILARDLIKIRGGSPIPPIAILALQPLDAYIDFTSAFFSEEGEFATSGGMYITRGPSAFPLLSINAVSKHAVEATVAHELTHHALHGCNLPLWIEEGLTQMMEERVTKVPNFTLNAEMIQRQRELVEEHGLDGLLSGSGFFSARDDEQELTYHLAQWVTRSLLTTRPDAFFAFARDCRTDSSHNACVRHFDLNAANLVHRIVSGKNPL